MKITEILEGFQLQKNQWALDISNDAKHEVSDDLINLVQTAYAGTAQGSFVNNVSNLLPSDWAVLDFDADPDVDSAVFYRGPRAHEPWTGFKIQGLGHDGSRASKDRALDKLAEMLGKPGWWIESSGALRSVLTRRGCPAVSNQQLLQGLFPDSDLQMIDNTTYTRRLSEGGLVTETVFGNPRLNKMTGQLEEETLEELVGIKNKVKNLPGSMPAYDDETRVRYTHGMKWNQVMQDHGFQQLGSGLQASVYGHPKLPYVLKLFRSEDVAYAEWIKVAMANKNNPHMPRFVSKRMVRITQEIVAIRMEPLVPIEGIFLKIHTVSDRLLEGSLAASQPPSRLAGKLAYLPEYKYFEQYCNTHPHWMAALDITWNSMQRHGNDFHPGNCMRRGDDLVITDPVQ
jgi:hypothetical protein